MQVLQYRYVVLVEGSQSLHYHVKAVVNSA